MPGCQGRTRLSILTSRDELGQPRRQKTWHLAPHENRRTRLILAWTFESTMQRPNPRATHEHPSRALEAGLPDRASKGRKWLKVTLALITSKGL